MMAPVKLEYNSIQTVVCKAASSVLNLESVATLTFVKQLQIAFQASYVITAANAHGFECACHPPRFVD